MSTMFKDLFGNTPVIGMIHLAGRGLTGFADRAIEELEMYADLGVDGAIVENYHGSKAQVNEVLSKIHNDLSRRITIGVNILPNEFEDAFIAARRYGAKFIQLDHVAGTYEEYGTLDIGRYQLLRNQEKIAVFGGVHPKYYTPLEESDLQSDLETAMQRVDAIVVTGEETGKETPLTKIREFREYIGDYPLIVGAGLTPENAYDQLMIADGCIVGSAFKRHNSTNGELLPLEITSFMDVVKQVRKDKL